MSLKSNGNPVCFEAGKFLPSPPSNGATGQENHSSGNGGNGGERPQRRSQGRQGAVAEAGERLRGRPLRNTRSARRAGETGSQVSAGGAERQGFAAHRNSAELLRLMAATTQSYQQIAPDVKLGRGVRIYGFTNLYGCETGTT